MHAGPAAAVFPGAVVLAPGSAPDAVDLGAVYAVGPGDGAGVAATLTALARLTRARMQEEGGAGAPAPA